MVRAYKQQLRADARADRRLKAIEATGLLIQEEGFDGVTLQAVADRAELSLKSVVRYFGSKEGLFEACMTEGVRREEGSRETAVGDVRGAALTLAHRYEAIADWTVKNAHVEFRLDVMRRWVAKARKSHAGWLARVFAPWLAVDPPAREARIMALFWATEIRAWWAVRHAFGHDFETATTVMTELLEALVASWRGGSNGEDRTGDVGRRRRGPAVDAGGAAPRPARPRRTRAR